MTARRRSTATGRRGGADGRRCIEKWQEAAPNLKNGAFLEWTTYTPLDISRRIPNMVQGDWMSGLIDLENMLDQRPFPELSQYSTPIKNLYMCGATQHPHGFVTFAPAYNALQVIAEDYGLERWWRGRWWLTPRPSPSAWRRARGAASPQ